ncbi:MAG: glycosyltransferase [Bacteroidales bacterium]|nr:glycosyltransferase [Bacteroidales bacterium]HNW73379.1 glycosyltransferase [Bacteroidales bacterium]HPS50711.1 glycosyltransferase [Bacteroidales bacterium]
MNRKIKVLFITRWYPNRYDPMPGLFIQRLAEALTPWCDLAVVCVFPDTECSQKNEVDFKIENEVRVLRIYLRKKSGKPRTLQTFFDFVRYYRLFLKAVKSIKAFRPDLIHGHIMTRAGFVTWKLSRRMKIPFVISEHWSRYFPNNNTYHGWLRKYFTRLIIGKAAAVIAVSEPLMDAMKKHRLLNPNYRLLPNIVDTTCFRPGAPPVRESPKTVIHISCFDDRSKNISGFLEGVKKVRERRQDFRCLVVGDGPDRVRLKDFSESLNLREPDVVFTGLLTGEDLASILRNSDLSVVTSHYETFGTVVIESLASGVPVLSTRVGIACEVITEENGLLVDASDPEAFADALDGMLDRCRSFDKEKIAASVGRRFTPEVVGNMLVEIYQGLIGYNPSTSNPL